MGKYTVYDNVIICKLDRKIHSFTGTPDID
jgi:hypothetical protein